MSDTPEDPLLVSPGRMGESVMSMLALGQIEFAKQLAMDFIAANPDAPGGHMALARVLAHEGLHAEALTVLEEGALPRDPANDEVHLQRAEVLTALGRFAEAEEAVRRAIELDPTWSPNHATYAALLWSCDRDVEALQRTEHALSMSPNHSYLHTMRAQLLLFVHPRHWTISEEAVRTSLRMNPASATAHAVLGLVLLRGHKYAEAEEAFRAALRIHPHDALALRGLSELLKGKSWIYRPMLWFSQMMSRLGTEGQLGILFGLWALYAAAQALMPAGNKSAGDLLTVVYLGFCAYTWFAEPITRALLKRHYPWLE